MSNLKVVENKMGYRYVHLQDANSGGWIIQESDYPEESRVYVGRTVQDNYHVHLNQEQVAEVIPLLVYFKFFGRLPTDSYVSGYVIDDVNKLHSLISPILKKLKEARPDKADLLANVERLILQCYDD